MPEKASENFSPSLLSFDETTLIVGTFCDKTGNFASLVLPSSASHLYKLHEWGLSNLFCFRGLIKTCENFSHGRKVLQNSSLSGRESSFYAKLIFEALFVPVFGQIGAYSLTQFSFKVTVSSFSSIFVEELFSSIFLTVSFTENRQKTQLFSYCLFFWPVLLACTIIGSQKLWRSMLALSGSFSHSTIWVEFVSGSRKLLKSTCFMWMFLYYAKLTFFKYDIIITFYVRSFLVPFQTFPIFCCRNFFFECVSSRKTGYKRFSHTEIAPFWESKSFTATIQQPQRQNFLPQLTKCCNFNGVILLQACGQF